MLRRNGPPDAPVYLIVHVVIIKLIIFQLISNRTREMPMTKTEKKSRDKGLASYADTSWRPGNVSGQECDD